MAYKVLASLIVLSIGIIRLVYQRKYYASHAIRLRRVKPARENVLVILVVLSYGIPYFLWLLTDWIDFASIASDRAFKLFGFLIALCSAIGYGWVHVALGNNWSPILEIRANHQLVTSGPFRLVRHPMYFSMWLGVVRCPTPRCRTRFSYYLKDFSPARMATLNKFSRGGNGHEYLST